VRRSLGSNANWLEIYALLRPRRKIDAGALAEGVGFEPTIRFPVYTLSKRAP